MGSLPLRTKSLTISCALVPLQRSWHAVARAQGGQAEACVYGDQGEWEARGGGLGVIVQHSGNKRILCSHSFVLHLLNFSSVWD